MPAGAPGHPGRGYPAHGAPAPGYTGYPASHYPAGHHPAHLEVSRVDQYKKGLSSKKQKGFVLTMFNANSTCALYW